MGYGRLLQRVGLSTTLELAWVVRDDGGKVLMHSSKVLSNIGSLEDAKFQGLIWSVESLSYHHLRRIIVAIDDATLPKVILRPNA